jgi:hypothetical protein
MNDASWPPSQEVDRRHLFPDLLAELETLAELTARHRTPATPGYAGTPASSARSTRGSAPR